MIIFQRYLQAKKMNESNKREIIKEVRISTLKGLIGAIPFAGTAINEAVFEARSRIKQNRVNTFIENFGEYLNQFNEDDLNLEQIKNDDFGDFFEELIIKVSKTRSEIKRTAFQTLLTNQLINASPIDFAELILETISSLQEKQIPILYKLYDHYDSLYTTYKGILIGQQKELSQLEKELKKEYWNLDSAEDAIFVDEIKDLENKIETIKKEIKKNEDIVEENKEPYLAQTYDCKNHEFYFLIQDLVNKGLLVDLGMKYNAEPFDLVEITSLGMELIDTLKEQKPAGNTV